ncbi:MAG: ABC-F family ATP-binding cassette domain-containing protein [Collinsella sp.]|uniref:ABC-F family ATP-binding cassette domain-containing protein n=1 Tax=Collinsella intestinalis TaxID=147207 RepID=A0A943BNZ0_9ACTN|nr:ABC-F family ATP-binding cassette domain-containing protein [Collinsella intestinalis]MBS5146211.1 ABC-F family ATP-binding cassette domain-containing protein [Collinsella intestinalis]MDO5364570.1 ABC-F family ATP-binding cassette domain-containing protein [Collinsella sp.]
MAILLGCDSVHLEFPTKLIAQDVTLGVNEGDRIGIVGKNGDGKSSLLGVLSGAVPPDAGRVTRRRDVTVGVLGQRDALDSASTVHRAVVGDLPEYEWAASPRVRQILDGLIADVPWEGLVGELSGGQRRRVDLARLLIGDYDVLMLDEPTNHLDMRTINWLAEHLKSRWQRGSGAMLVVTHDRWFLDEVCTSMWEVHDGCVDPFEGGYSAYILQRVERDRMAAVTEERRRNMARKELAWLSRGAQARSTKPKFRVEAARELIADVPPVRNELELKRLAVSRLGKQVIDVIDVDAGYENGAAEDGFGAPASSRPVLSDVTWLIGAGDRYGLLGENGAGKTTLLNVIQGKLSPRRGRVKIGSTVRFGVLSQQLDELKPVEDDTIREVLARGKRYVMVEGKETSPEKLLERLGFTQQQMWSRIKDLSGGQKRRLSLLLTILEEPNVLILDEPGNDLDTDMLALVEDLLDSWPGTLILVTHDRFLMERVTDQQWALIGGTLRHVPGGVDEYLRLTEGLSAGGSARPQAPGFNGGQGGDPNLSNVPQTGAQGPRNGLSNAERQRLKKEVASLERKMETRRAKVEELERGMFGIDPTDFAALTAQQDAVAAARDELDELEMAWLEASERLETSI